MKKIKFIIIILVLVVFPSIVNAKKLDYDYYKKLNVKYAFIVGDYMFNMDNGYSPTLEDIMIASRTIAADEPTTLYEIRMFPAWNFFSISMAIDFLFIFFFLFFISKLLKKHL